MHQLFLLRHAKAESALSGVSDHDRILTEKGRRDAGMLAQAMRKAGLAPEVVLVSTATRTRQTLEELETASVWDEWPNIDALPQLYMATLPQLLNTIRDLPETVRSALIIGHNPGLHELALRLAGHSRADSPALRLAQGYPAATLSEFLVAGSWRQTSEDITSLKRLLSPADSF